LLRQLLHPLLFLDQLVGHLVIGRDALLLHFLADLQREVAQAFAPVSAARTLALLADFLFLLTGQKVVVCAMVRPEGRPDAACVR